MTTTRRQMIEAEIRSLQGELTSLIRQKQGFLMGAFDDYNAAIRRAAINGWQVKYDGDTIFTLTRTDKEPITIQLIESYGKAICKTNQVSVTKNTPEGVYKYLDTYTRH